MTAPPPRKPRDPAALASLTALVNIGPACAAWLVDAGIDSPARLRELGALAAFRRVAVNRGGDVSLNLLYALHGALRGVRWDHLGAEERARLRAESEAP